MTLTPNSSTGCEAYGIYEGYEGLIQGGDLIKQMFWGDVRGWLSEGGTLIGTARCPAFHERPGKLQAAKNLIDTGIDALVIIGGDGSLTGANAFREEWPSLLQELVQKGDLTKSQVVGDMGALMVPCGMLTKSTPGAIQTPEHCGNGRFNRQRLLLDGCYNRLLFFPGK